MGQVRNDHQTQVYFDPSANSPINAVEDETVHISTCSYEKQRFTVLLTILSDNKQLPPFI